MHKITRIHMNMNSNSNSNESTFPKLVNCDVLTDVSEFNELLTEERGSITKIHISRVDYNIVEKVKITMTKLVNGVEEVNEFIINFKYEPFKQIFRSHYKYFALLTHLSEDVCYVNIRELITCYLPKLQNITITHLDSIIDKSTWKLNENIHELESLTVGIIHKSRFLTSIDIPIKRFVCLASPIRTRNLNHFNDLRMIYRDHREFIRVQYFHKKYKSYYTILSARDDSILCKDYNYIFTKTVIVPYEYIQLTNSAMTCIMKKLNIEQAEFHEFNDGLYESTVREDKYGKRILKVSYNICIDI